MRYVSMGGNIKTNNMAEQTAVQWLENYLYKILYLSPREREKVTTGIEHAKAIERLQIMEANTEGVSACINKKWISGKHYYDKTFLKAD